MKRRRGREKKEFKKESRMNNRKMERLKEVN